VNPVLEGLAHPLVVLVEVRQVCQAAVLNIAHVIPVSDVAVGVVVFCLVVRIYLPKIVADGGHVVCDNVNHYPDALRVRSCNKLLEVVSGAEVRIYSIPVTCPIPMVARRQIIDNGANPDRIEPHPLDVVQVVF